MPSRFLQRATSFPSALEPDTAFLLLVEVDGKSEVLRQPWYALVATVVSQHWISIISIVSSSALPSRSALVAHGCEQSTWPEDRSLVFFSVC
ncbi:hypothetical protein Hypma_006460 [Hypsizygus marmoreus]|uniref:Uncharacterized protein n=1 Tax=Hypsizygus marmoreus TaxID=39966 RepID=A0A369JV47_HYPMA|nr:hypothetical protein Hypma_006460 [Hypsizygus marmoreus]